MAPVPSRRPFVELAALDLGSLGLFFGQRMNERVLELLHRGGFTGVRESHLRLFDHLADGPQTIGELAKRMGVTQQAASKAVREAVSLGFLESAPGADARVRQVRLSTRGTRAVRAARPARAKLAAKAARDLSPADLEASAASARRRDRAARGSGGGAAAEGPPDGLSGGDAEAEGAPAEVSTGGARWKVAGRGAHSGGARSPERSAHFAAVGSIPRHAATATWSSSWVPPGRLRQR